MGGLLNLYPVSLPLPIRLVFLFQVLLLEYISHQMIMYLRSNNIIASTTRYYYL